MGDDDLSSLTSVLLSSLSKTMLSFSLIFFVEALDFLLALDVFIVGLELFLLVLFLETSTELSSSIFSFVCGSGARLGHP